MDNYDRHSSKEPSNPSRTPKAHSSMVKQDRNSSKLELNPSRISKSQFSMIKYDIYSFKPSRSRNSRSLLVRVDRNPSASRSIDFKKSRNDLRHTNFHQNHRNRSTMTGDLLFIIKIIQLDARMIVDHLIPIGTIQNIFELNMWAIELSNATFSSTLIYLLF